MVIKRYANRETLSYKVIGNPVFMNYCITLQYVIKYVVNVCQENIKYILDTVINKSNDYRKGI